MVHIVKKNIGNHEYLYLQKSFHIKGKRKKRTEHFAYLGKANNYSNQQIKNIISVANNSTRGEAIKLIKKYNKLHKKSKTG